MDQRCASSCESTIDAFEFYPQAKKVGENTAGFIHFGNVSPAILPNSKIMVQIGIKPDIPLPEGTDALAHILKLIGGEK